MSNLHEQFNFTKKEKNNPIWACVINTSLCQKSGWRQDAVPSDKRRDTRILLGNICNVLLRNLVTYTTMYTRYPYQRCQAFRFYQKNTHFVGHLPITCNNTCIPDYRINYSFLTNPFFHIWQKKAKIMPPNTISFQTAYVARAQRCGFSHQSVDLPFSTSLKCWIKLFSPTRSSVFAIHTFKWVKITRICNPPPVGEGGF